MLHGTDDPELVEVLGAVHEACRAVGADYAVIGGVALLAHGGQRGTMDLDLSLGLDPVRVDAFLSGSPRPRI